MHRMIAVAVSLSLASAPTPAFAAAAGTSVTTEETELASFKLASQDSSAAPATTVADDPANTDHRLNQNKSNTGKKVLKGAAITLGVVGALVAGFLVFYRVKCGPGARECSE